MLSQRIGINVHFVFSIFKAVGLYAEATRVAGATKNEDAGATSHGERNNGERETGTDQKQKGRRTE